MNQASNDVTATIVGGGPAGLIAAETLVNRGVNVAIYDHMPSLGRKFLLAGRGGLNITHTEAIGSFLNRYGDRRPQLEQAINAFGPEQLRQWCQELNEPTFVGTSGRVFPQSFRATKLLRAWLIRLGEQGVTQKVRHRWLGWGRDEQDNVVPTLSKFSDASGGIHEVTSDITILAMGGASWPRVGSTGNWVSELTSSGVPVEPLRPANCGVAVEWSEIMTERFAGQPLKNISVTVDGVVDGDGVSDGVSVRGDAMVTRAGLEGGPVYAHSAAISKMIESRVCMLRIDLHPDLDQEALTARLTKRRRPKDSVSTWLKRSGMSSVEIALMREASANELPSSPHKMAALIKAVPVAVSTMMPIDRAISTAGGVSFAALDEHFMIKQLPGVFVAGEMLDWQAPTGGYLLQASFSSGVATANAALDFVSEHNEQTIS